MRKRFSERYNYKKPNNTLQIERMDNGLKNRIWNQIQKYFFDTIEVDLDAFFQPSKIRRYLGNENVISVKGGSLNQIIKDEDYEFFRNIYDTFFEMKEKPSTFLNDINIEIEKKYNNFSWSEVYDFIEYIAEIYYDKGISLEFKKSINNVLEDKMSGYRFVDSCIVPIIDDIEIQEIEGAVNSKYAPAKRHLVKALERLSDRKNPDYVNSIKESISAVEAVTKKITGKETDLATCLKVMDLDLNKQFKTAMTNMYGWTNKEDGIRHGHTGEELKTSFEEAKYMLVTCSAFINYMIAKQKQTVE